MLEVGHIYGTQADAKRLLGRFAENSEIANSAKIPLKEKLLKPLNTLLEKKSESKYQTSRVWLLIRSAFPLWEREGFKTYQSSIIIPRVHPFEQIWLLCSQDVLSGILRLA